MERKRGGAEAREEGLISSKQVRYQLEWCDNLCCNNYRLCNKITNITRKLQSVWRGDNAFGVNVSPEPAFSNCLEGVRWMRRSDFTQPASPVRS